MTVLHSPEFLTFDLIAGTYVPVKGAVVAIGNFDGVHRGHQAVLEKALMLGQKSGVPVIVMTLEPHPRTVFKPQSPVFRLTPAPMKARVLAGLGIDGMAVLPFSIDIAKTPAEQFIDTYLVELLEASHVVTGYDFHFGKDRQGSPDFLKKSGRKKGFKVSVIEAFNDENEEVISSSRIRRLLGAADVVGAAGLLGYRWTVSETVQKGAQLGRTLGYPTANIELPPECHLAHAIYAVRLRRGDGTLLDGVASFGRRPTFDNGNALFETFIFDFDDDLYGETIEVSIFGHLRGEEKFDSAEALVKQMDKDSEEARALLAGVKPFSSLDLAIAF